jgi:hypothetical protein
MPRAYWECPFARGRLAFLAMTKPDIGIACVATRHNIRSSDRRAPVARHTSPRPSQLYPPKRTNGPRCF